MRFSIYLEKHKILRLEAEEDLSMGLFNKATSAFWFSLEALLRYLLIKSGKSPPERAGPLISMFVKEVIRDPSNRQHLRNLLNSIYARRREVDHRRKLADKRYAEKVYDHYKKALDIISKETHVKTNI